MQVLGRAKLYLNGVLIETMPGLTLTLGGVNRKPVKAGGSVHYAEETQEATIEGETVLSSDTTLAALRNFAGGTVVFLADTGQQYAIRDAFTTEPPSLKDGDGGNVTIRIAGQAAEELA